jgi:hypothetical protein
VGRIDDFAPGRRITRCPGIQFIAFSCSQVIFFDASVLFLPHGSASSRESSLCSLTTPLVLLCVISRINNSTIVASNPEFQLCKRFFGCLLALTADGQKPLAMSSLGGTGIMVWFRAINAMPPQTKSSWIGKH